MKTYMQKKKDLTHNWHLIDLKGLTLGRASTEIARLLMGKNSPHYTPHLDSGDFVVAINANDIVLSGNKMSTKVYSRHSGQPGGYKEETVASLMQKDPRKVIEHAVKGMLPKNKLQTQRLRRLKVYSGSDHPHSNHFNNKEA